MATINEMRQVATQIENETQVGGNTAGRVGGLFNDIVDKLEDDEANINIVQRVEITYKQCQIPNKYINDTNVGSALSLQSNNDYGVFYFFVRKGQSFAISSTYVAPSASRLYIFHLDEDLDIVQRYENVVVGTTTYTATEDCIVVGTLYGNDSIQYTGIQKAYLVNGKMNEVGLTGANIIQHLKDLEADIDNDITNLNTEVGSLENEVFGTPSVSNLPLSNNGVLNANGTISLYEDWYNSDYFAVDSAKQYTYNGSIYGGGNILYYDSAKNLLGACSNIPVNYADRTNPVELNDMPSNAAYIRVSGYDISACSITESDSLRPKVEKIEERIDNLIKPQGIIEPVFSATLGNPVRIKLLGDSITQGWGGSNFDQDGAEIYPLGEGWQTHRNLHGYCWANMMRDYLETKYHCTVVNNAITGTSTRNIVTRLDDFIDAADDIVICAYGTNNRNNYDGNNTEWNSFVPDLFTIVNYCKERNKTIILVANIPASSANEQSTDNGHAKSAHMNDVHDAVLYVAESTGVECVDMYDAFNDYCINTNTSLGVLLGDGLHPNDNGYDVYYSLIMPRIGVAIESAAESGGVIDGNSTTIKVRRNTAAVFTSSNPVLADGELGFETDRRRYKMGDGVTTWNNLDYRSEELDATPTPNSTNGVESGGVYNELHTEEHHVFELGSIDTANGNEVTQTNGTRMRSRDYVPKSSNIVIFTTDRASTECNLLLYNDRSYAGYLRLSSNLAAGTHSFTVNVNYTWNQFRVVCFTTGATAQNVVNNYAYSFLSLKDRVAEIDNRVEVIEQVLPQSGEQAQALPLTQSDYAYGNISGTDGTIQTSDKVIYTTEYIDVRNAASLSYTLHNSYRLGVAVYDANKTFLYKDEWFTGSGVYDFSNAVYIRLVIAYPSGGSSFDYSQANPSFSLNLLGFVPVASVENVEAVYDYFNDVLFKGSNYRFELGSIDGANGQLVENTTGNRIRSKEYIPKGDGVMRLTMVMSAARANLIFYKNGLYVGWIDSAITNLSAGDYTYKISTPFDYDSYKVACFVSGATSTTANNTYVTLPPAAYFGTSDEGINIEALTTSKIYDYYDGLVDKFPNFISRKTLGNDSSGNHEIREYVATLRDSFAYLYKERCYAWKNGSTTIFTQSISPRVGDATYTDQLTTSTGYTVSASNCTNGTITVGGTVYSRYSDGDLAADVVFRTTGTSATVSSGGKTYTRYPNYDKSSTHKKTIVCICNEHGPGSNGDPREPSVVMYYLLRALCGETNTDQQLDWIKQYAKLVIIPVANPYAYDEEGNPSTLGNLMGRVNANGVNINRNYPTTNWVSLSQNEAGAYGGSEIETQYNINCVMRHNADIAIDEHCLGPNTNNYNQWHYEGVMSNSISAQTKMMMNATYNLAYSSYGENLAGHGDTWFEEQGKGGCLLEMNQGYGETLHSEQILMADRWIFLYVLVHYNVFSL